MDRDDAAFAADALACRIAGDREGLEQLAASSLMRLSTIATVLRKQADGWRPALVGAAELMAICRRGGKLHLEALDPDLHKIVDSLRSLAAEPPAQPNRAARRASAASLPRAERRRTLQPARLVH